MDQLAIRRSWLKPNMALVAFWGLALTSSVTAYTLTGCSSLNTGANNPDQSSSYMSVGLCHDTCVAQYAFAIVSAENCWCSNYAPADTVSTSSCNSPCPGYPYEFCGAPSASLYGYLALTVSPSGTQGSGPSTSAVVESAPVTNTITVLATATLTPSVSSVSLVSSLAQSSTTQATLITSVGSPMESSTGTSTWSPSPYASVKTVFGSVQTVIITPTQPPQAVQTGPALINPSNDGSSFWDNTAKVAGTFVVVGLIIAGIVALGVWLFFRRFRTRHEAMTVTSNDGEAPTSSNGAPYMVDRRRSNLTLTTAGLGGLTRGSSNEKSPVDKTPGSMSRRGSIPMAGHDQRLNPAALWAAHPNGSHVSVASFRDDQDYSRPVLHVRNPDVG